MKETLKTVCMKIAAVCDWAAGYVANYPKTSLAILVALAVKAIV